MKKQFHFAFLLAILALVVVGNDATECGIANRPARITGGIETLRNEFPWVAYLRLVFWSGTSAQCGGTLIHERWILTAAHCLYGVVNVTVVLGAHDINNPSSLGRQEFSTKKWISHPLWRYGDVENDIAVIELPVAATMTDYVRPACLPYPDDPSLDGWTVTITGWGNYSSDVNSGSSPVLRSVRSSVIDSSGTTGLCQQKAADVGPFHGDKIICSDSSYNRHFCHGDDGGPMNYHNAYWNTFTVVGVAWIGDPSVECSVSTKPNICARVSYYVDWIHDTTGIPRLPKPTTTTTTTTTTPAPTTAYFTCEGKPSGLYPNPACTCCTTFYKCSNGYAYLYDCPDNGTVFDPQLLVCVFHGDLPACQV